MKKYLFLLILPLLFFIPNDVFAAEVPVKELVLYNSSWQVLDSCKLAEESCSFAVSPVDGTVLHLRATYNYNFYAGNTYAFEWTFKTGSGITYSFAPHRPNIGINGEYQDLTNVQWRQEKEEIINQNRFKTYYFYTDFTSKNTTSSSAYPPYVQAEISNPSSTSIYFESLSLSIVNKGADTGSIIQNSTQTIIDNQNKNQQQTNEKLDDLNDSINNDDVTDAEDSASGFFNDFESDDFGLSSIITMPLQFIQGLSSSTCYSLNLPLPFVDTNVTLPCMTSIYQRYFGDFLTLYQIITTGFIAYGVCINIFRLVQGFKNPDNDNVEVMEL